MAFPKIFPFTNQLMHYIAFVNISTNLNFISEKMYKCTKQLIVNDLLVGIRKHLILKDDYESFFEQLNLDYNLSTYDYKLIIYNNYLKNIKENTPKYYISQYVQNVLGLEISDN